MTQSDDALPAPTAPEGRVLDVSLSEGPTAFVLTVATVVSVFAIWLVDVSTGPDYGFAVFYLIPIGAASWWLGRRAAVLIAILSGIAWITADVISRLATSLPASVWNGITRTVIFLILAVLLDQVRRERTALHNVDAHREESLALIAHTLQRSAAEIETAIGDAAHAPGLSATERDAILDLRRQSRNFNRFAEDVLEVGQLETGHFRLNRGRFDLSEFVATVAKETDRDRLQLVAESDPVWVNADPERLRTAIEHLLNNALRFSPSGSTVHVSVSIASGRARVTVKDQGVGLARAHLDTIFKKYGRIETPQTRDRIGVGLGLYVVRLIAEAHGGTVSGSSVGLGLGSTFVLELPLAEAPGAV
jgi:signal transduction histidine kinase